mmetsp:Transcript_21856/g.37336  ORF Transcript_21856/g.37336 Transcript_21856/m.37336 type:complete len:307 (+) Transcript_21856:137-1057(+)|eukprot:CAMPEP_0119108860 /NCGR_PEP_ID=MMETSP1180-20130426/15818_1 /TAXON_ID=3052 ORGANISM="Chlamydomonas cf sp, Strain CCMP681" /NCGR_SAMPLE_ID=MMETSP1180 /ASSEMBLY_ACC=CAM_ASM_000741 /LENGTH=306 /DNA_ID=CAMNT_0007094529 /DNA_START=112 /DNA_END=1032 /DNA_ORIENTATION=+
MAMRQAGANFPYRHPAASGAIENVLSGVGSIFRTMGVALDEFGAKMQGSAAVRETAQPNLAWAPVQPEPGSTPSQGVTVRVPTVTSMPSLSSIVMPVKGEGVFVAPSANVLGDVKIGANSSIWYGAVLRGDVNGISIGSNSNIQDNVVIHVAKHSISGQPRPTVIGDNVTIGHGATIHACTIGDNSLVGMGATVLDGCVVEKESIVAAGAVLPPNTKVGTRQVWAGNPARKLRDMSIEEVDFLRASADNYSDLASVHQFENGKSFEEQYTELIIQRDRYLASDPANTIHQMWVFDKQTMLVVRPKK